MISQSGFLLIGIVLSLRISCPFLEMGFQQSLNMETSFCIWYFKRPFLTEQNCILMLRNTTLHSVNIENQPLYIESFLRNIKNICALFFSFLLRRWHIYWRPLHERQTLLSYTVDIIDADYIWAKWARTSEVIILTQSSCNIIASTPECFHKGGLKASDVIWITCLS